MGQQWEDEKGGQYKITDFFMDSGLNRKNVEQRYGGTIMSQCCSLKIHLEAGQ